MKLDSFNGMVSCQTIYRLTKKNQQHPFLPREGKRYRQRKGIEAGTIKGVDSMMATRGAIGSYIVADLIP